MGSAPSAAKRRVGHENGRDETYLDDLYSGLSIITRMNDQIGILILGHQGEDCIPRALRYGHIQSECNFSVT